MAGCGSGSKTARSPRICGVRAFFGGSVAEPRVLLLDVETLPNVVTSWGLKVDGYLDHANILAERQILCAAWKWLGVPGVRSISPLAGKVPGKPADYKIVRRLAEELGKADAVVTHNGDKFDLPWIRTRMIALDLPPHPPVVSIDTKKIARDRFYFNSNRLDYLGQYLGLGKKIHTDFTLWLRCMMGEKSAIKEMVRYNERDVELLETVYLKLRPYCDAKLNRALWAKEHDGKTCPTCGEQDLESRGMRVTRTAHHHRYACGSCGAWSSRPVNSKVVR